MTEPLPDTWHWRELPVLRIVVGLWDTEQMPLAIGQVKSALPTLEPRDVERALSALLDEGIIEGQRWGDGVVNHRIRPRPGARALAGSWPTTATGVERLIAALENIAENTEDEEQRTRLQQFAGFLKSSGQQVGLSLATAVLTGQVT